MKDIIDFHIHLVDMDYCSKRKDCNNFYYYDYFESRPYSAEELLQQMDITGIEKAVLLCIEDSWGFSNEIAENAIRKYPQKFKAMGFIGLDVKDPKDKVKELKEKGFTGLKFEFPAHWLIDLRTKRFIEIYREAGKQNMPVFLHTGGYITPDVIKDICHSCPHTIFIAAHFAQPNFEEFSSLLCETENLYSEISGGWGRYPDLYGKALQQIVINGGEDKLLFGTDSLSARPDYSTLIKKRVELISKYTKEFDRQKIIEQKLFKDNALSLLRKFE